jgi:hypothetical protein
MLKKGRARESKTTMGSSKGWKIEGIVFLNKRHVNDKRKRRVEVRIVESEVKFLDFNKSNISEGVLQQLIRQPRTKVGGSKTIRYRRSFNLKQCRLEIGSRFNVEERGKRAIFSFF